jgi:transcription-repair coupling factor (superfamily II helicase)
VTDAPLADLPRLLADDPALLAAVSGRADVLAVPEAARALFAAALHRVGGARPVVLAVPTAAEAERIAGDLRPMLGAAAVELFPAWETLPFERVSPALETMGRRLRVIWRLRRGGDDAPAVVVAPVRALVQRLGPHVEDCEPVVLGRADVVDRDALLEALVAAGYRREYQVESRGEVAVRGSIVDVYPSTADHPVRIDLWGDEVDRLSVFSVADQRSTHDLDRVTIFPCRELLPTPEVRARAEALLATAPWAREQWDRIAQGQTFDGMESWLPWLADGEHLLSDLLPPNARVLLVEPRRMRDRAQELLDDEAALADTLAGTWGAEGHDFPRLSLPFDRLLAHTRAASTSLLAAPDAPSTPQLAAAAFDPVVGDVEALAQRIRSLRDGGSAVVLAAEGTGSAHRLADVLSGEGLEVAVTERPVTSAGALSVVVAPLERGVVLPAAGLALVAEADLTGRRRVHRVARGARKAADYYEDLKPGDFVVHQVHGVGRYEGMVARAIGGVERDYLLLAYRGGDKLYVPTDQVGTVRRYTGGDSPSLSKMGGADWQKARSRVKSAVREIAAELVILYRKRLATPGFAFSADTPWQHEVEEAFPYEETPDQLQAIMEVKADMERPVPMDRLVCGDVGYGKTEVAMRAAFKAVQDGKQVAVLAPTTLLANQHGQTFRERFAGYPVRVEVLSRFLTPKEQDQVVAAVARGEVDVIVGTHRLLSDDVRLKDLGLLVVDEEQRFGVTHKEKIKQLRANVDVLTLTATPIPRTLELSLTGIRDLSLVQTPPEARQPILTYVGEFDDRAVSEAIRRELLREGQVFYVHNRVQDIEHVAAQVRELVPEARVAIAHGQMDEGALERIVLDFADHEYDVLVCTTIVESGLDMPTVNTLVVDRADLLGLAQLYQLRGRVGRRGQRAYAYLLHPPDRALSEEAYERLKAIGEFTDLGSGFKLALRDLEIRGAGNMLGGAQSGHIAAVGFDLYCELVTEAVGELKGEEKVEPFEVVIDVPVDAHLPREYVARDDVRMEAYRRLASVTRPEDVDDVLGEWNDRYGPPPPPAAALLAVARLRAECVRVGATSISVQKGVARIDGLTLKESEKVRLKRLVPRAVAKDDGEVAVPLTARAGDVPEALVAFLQELRPAA